MPVTDIHRGDLRVVRSAGRPGPVRLALVLTDDTGPGIVEIALAHPYVELATAADVVVPAAAAGTAYAVVVQSDLRGVVWAGQTGPRVGRLSERLLATASDLVATGPCESREDVRIGIPLVGPHDRRWTFKVGEGRALDRLTSDCTATVLAGPSPREG